jgi:hypothetical protein
MGWLRFFSAGRSRMRRAYFRPTDTTGLDTSLAPLVNHIVSVRFVGVGKRKSQFDGQRLYRNSTPRFVRPEGDFDFLD